jgi:predicted dehydrogenase
VTSTSRARPVRVAVIGCGHFGRLHAEKYAALPAAELIAVCDLDGGRAAALARELGCAAETESRRLPGRVDAVSIAVATAAHYAVAAPFLAAGIACLVEKPIAVSLEEALELERLAKQGAVLQVGHLERFNPALRAALPRLGRPLFIEGHRLTPFRGRGTDVDVVLDLLIHDLDLLQLLVSEAPAAVDAVGVPVLSARDDIVNVRLTFPGGCVANLTASRVSLKQERRLRIFAADLYLALDLLDGSLTVARRSVGEAGVPSIGVERIEGGPGDPLRAQIEAFLAAVRGEAPVAVTAADGRRALELALRVSAALRRPSPG